MTSFGHVTTVQGRHIVIKFRRQIYEKNKRMKYGTTYCKTNGILKAQTTPTPSSTSKNGYWVEIVIVPLSLQLND